MRTIVLFLFLLPFFMVNSQSIKSDNFNFIKIDTIIEIVPKENKILTIKIVDEETEEPLVAVFNKDNFRYSDINGNLLLENGKSLKLNLISYKEIYVKKIKNDTIIKMKSL